MGSKLKEEIVLFGWQNAHTPPLVPGAVVRVVAWVGVVSVVG